MTVVLKGELSDVGLSEVFQMLSASGKEGTLTVKSGKRRMHIYFGRNSIRLMCEGDVSHTALGKLLLRTNRITQEQLTEALQRQQQTGDLLGKTLVDMGFLSEEDVINSVKTQLEEEICNVFLWENAEFEFVPGRPTKHFADTALVGREIPFGVAEVLFEAARRVDEWRKVLQEIEKTRAEFEIASKDSLPPDPSPLGFSYEDVYEVVALIDRVRRVDEILGRTPLSKLEVARLLAFLLRTGYIKRVEKPVEKKPAVSRPTVSTDWRLGISLDVEDTELKKRLEIIIWTEETKEKAVAKVIELADSMVLEGKLDEAVPVYQFALDMQPDNTVVRAKLVHLYVLQWRFADAAKILVAGYRKQIFRTES